MVEDNKHFNPLPLLENVTTAGLQIYTVASARNFQMLTNKIISISKQQNALSDYEIAILYMCGSSAKLFLKQLFGNSVISRHFTFSWPQKSHDLTPNRFLSVGTPEIQRVCINTQTVSDLTNAITHQVHQIPFAMLQASFLSFTRHMQRDIMYEEDPVESL